MSSIDETLREGEKLFLGNQIRGMIGELPSFPKTKMNLDQAARDIYTGFTNAHDSFIKALTKFEKKIRNSDQPYTRDEIAEEIDTIYKEFETNIKKEVEALEQRALVLTDTPANTSNVKNLQEVIRIVEVYKENMKEKVKSGKSSINEALTKHKENEWISRVVLKLNEKIENLLDRILFSSPIKSFINFISKRLTTGADIEMTTPNAPNLLFSKPQSSAASIKPLSKATIKPLSKTSSLPAQQKDISVGLLKPLTTPKKPLKSQDAEHKPPHRKP